VVGSSCLVFETAPSSADGSDMSRFLAVVWTIHPDLIPREVGCVIPEAVEPFVVHQPSLFLRASELIHSCYDTLQLRCWRFTTLHHCQTPITAALIRVSPATMAILGTTSAGVGGGPGLASFS
jgi:hypothetical protein